MKNAAIAQGAMGGPQIFRENFVFLFETIAKASQGENWTTKAKASAASRSILQDFLDSVKALAWLELECYIRFLSG